MKANVSAPGWLVVDLDHTLVRGDLFVDHWLRLLLARPLRAIGIFFRGLVSRPQMKAELARVVDFDPTLLPYNEAVLARIHSAKQDGRKVALISASHGPWVQAVAAHLGIFDYAAGTEAENLKGAQKVELIRRDLTNGDYEYMGDAWADVKIWQHSSRGVAVNPSLRLRRHLSRMEVSVETIHDRKVWRSYFKLLRPHQWVKNILIFTAPVAAHTLLSGQVLMQTLISFAGFCCAASTVYIVNDILDLEADRQHPTKRFRPLASGQISLFSGLVMAGVLFAATFLLTIPAGLPLAVPATLLAYMVANLAYSLWLKQMLVLDLIYLSLMYTVRIFVGALATDTFISNWLMSFSTFLFFGLAVLKRVIELKRSGHKARAYTTEDHITLLILGISSTFCAVMVLMLYFSSNEVRALYPYAERLWLLVPLALYSLSRLWLLCARGKVHDDPVVYSLTDIHQHGVLLAAAAVLWSAS